MLTAHEVSHCLLGHTDDPSSSTKNEEDAWKKVVELGFATSEQVAEYRHRIGQGIRLPKLEIGKVYHPDDVGKYVSQDDRYVLSKCYCEDYLLEYQIIPFGSLKDQIEWYHAISDHIAMERVGKISDLLRRDEEAHPIFIMKGNESLTISEGMHRSMAFMLHGASDIPVFFIIPQSRLIDVKPDKDWRESKKEIEGEWRSNEATRRKSDRIISNARFYSRTQVQHVMLTIGV